MPRSGLKSALGSAFLAGLGLGWSLRHRQRLRQFQGQTALVTGGSRGLGLALVRDLSRRGARVLFCARTADEVTRTESVLQAEGYPQVRGYVADISSPDGPMDLMKRVRSEHPRVDILVNNAGVIQVMPFVNCPETAFHDCLDTFLYGPLRMSQEVLSPMIAAGGGTIVNITSVGGQVPAPHLVAYNAGKAALVALSEGMSVELDRYGVTVLTVVPGLMRTGSHRNALFSGHSGQEYAWFRRAALHPALTVTAESAAHQIAEAILTRKRKLAIGWEAKLGPRFHALAPEWSHRMTSTVEKLLPGGGPDKHLRMGAMLEPETAPLSPLLQNIERQAVAQHQASRYEAATDRR